MDMQDLPWHPPSEVELIYSTPDCVLSLGTYHKGVTSPSSNPSSLPAQDKEGEHLNSG
jgi:hypothetical protein